MQRSIPFLWGLVIILLILNLLLLDALNLARLTAVESLSKIEAMLDSLSNEVIIYNVEVNQAVPVKVDVPLDRAMEIPINTVIPIDQVLTVPFQTPTGEITLDVPVKTDFPVDMAVPVNFNQTVSVDTVVQLNTTLPVEIDIAQTPLAAYLKQTQSEIAQLRRRLSLQRGGADEEEVRGVVAADSGRDASLTEATIETPPSQASSAGSEAMAAPASETTPQPDSPQVSQQATDLGDLSSDTAAQGPDLGLCAHTYWPPWPGTTWTYNSPDTSYTQRVDQVSKAQIFLSTQYEGQDLAFTMVCYQEGLGGNYLGDMRRISELGDFNLSNPRGVFLPRPEKMEQLGGSWRQEWDVAGTVRANQGASLLEGTIQQGRAVAVYTPIRFETVETPLGPQEALRVEQKLDFELSIDFNLENQTVPATEIINLTTVYWFVRDIGLVRMHWQGGVTQQNLEVSPTPIRQQFSVPPLAEEQLVLVCVTLGDQSVECARMPGVSESDLTGPPESELAVRGFVLSDILEGDSINLAGVDSSQPLAEEGRDDERTKLLAYTATVERLGAEMSEHAGEFWETALKFQDGGLTFDEFEDEFLDFVTEARAVIRGINQLSPPPQAESIHRELNDGLAKCDQAIDLMGRWFNNPESDTKAAAVLLVAECIEDVTQAGEELRALTGE